MLYILQVCDSFLNVYKISIVYRKRHANDKDYQPTQFGSKTATGPLRRHLFLHHVDEWVSSCDKLGIQITAKEAQDALEAYRKGKGQSSLCMPRIPYSKENFAKALVEFIVGNDQVCVYVVQILHHLIYLSLSMLLNHPNSINSFCSFVLN